MAIASRYPVRLLHISPEDFTFGRSLNLGCGVARGEAIVIASAHIYPLYPDWLERLLVPLADPRVAVVYGKQRGDSTTHFSEHRIFQQWFPEESVPRQASAFCNNANAAIRTSLWRQRPYHEELPGLEDVEWAMWAKQQGFSVSYSAEAEVIHVHHESPRAVFNRYRREAMALAQIRPSERLGLAEFVRLLAIHLIGDLRAALRQGIARRTWREILWFRWIQFWGTYRGFAIAGPLTRQLKETFFYPREPISGAQTSTRRMQALDYGALIQSDPGRVGEGREGTSG